MFSRRLLRVKVLQIAYAHSKSGDTDFNNSEKELFYSVDKAYDLYHYLLLIILDIADYGQSRLEISKNKRVPSFEDLNPNTRFVSNVIIEMFRNNDNFLQYLQSKKISWVNNPELIKELYKSLIDSDYYRDYMAGENTSFEDDKRLISKFFSDTVAQSETLFQLLEEQSIYWNDDVEFILSMILKTIKAIKSPHMQGDKLLLRMYKNDDDREFTKKLFRKTLLKQGETKEIIEKYTLNWDFDRIAYMDVLIMQMALTEVQEFSSIPIKVTINEYLELAKFFSTKNSSTFINGILDKSIHQLKKDNKIRKTGRGLVGEE